MSFKTYIGIDPGAKGGIAVISADGVKAFPYSDETLKNILHTYEGAERLVFVEKVGAMPKQGVVSMFRFGQSYGFILGVIEATNTPYDVISPQKWKKHFSLDGDKAKSIAAAKRLFPYVSLLPTERCRVDNDGMAEALLIALYAKRADEGKTI